MRRIIPGKHLIQEVVYEQRPILPIDKPIIQYIRQSTDGQVKNNKQSVKMQDEKLARRLLRMGWKEELIIKIDEDMGVSGQKRRDEREGLDRLYKLIESGKAGAVACYDVSRLYRDLTRVNYTLFVDMCERFNIPIITYHREYIPTNRADTTALIRDFEEAANRIEWINRVVIPAKMVAIEDAISYGGHCIPMGFLVVADEERKYYVPYEPHAQLIRWMFRRFRALGGNLSRLGRELRDINFKFPAFRAVEKKPHVALPFDGEGYPVKTRAGLIGILTNCAYIGWYVYNGMVVNKEAHEPIVPMDDFLYAYNRLSAYTLDGDINEAKPVVERRYGVGTRALLEGVLESDGCPVYAMAHHQNYVARTNNDGWKSAELVVPIAHLDGAFLQAFTHLLLIVESVHSGGFADSLYAQLEAVFQERQVSAVSLEHDLKEIEKGIRGWELDKESAREQGYKPGLDEANRQLRALHLAKEEIEQKIKYMRAEQDEVRETQSLLGMAFNQWDELPFERQKRFVKLLLQRANLVEAAPHVLKLTISLRKPLGGTLVGHIYRQRGSRAVWTDEENMVLKSLYQHADRLTILQALPNRTWLSIMQQALLKGLERTTRLNTSGIDENVCYNDVLVMQEVGLEKGGVKWGHEPEIEALIDEPITEYELHQMGCNREDVVSIKAKLNSLSALTGGFCKATPARQWG